MVLQQIVAYAYQIGFSFSIFVLISLGLAIIFGMMRVINLAQGEFLMLGAYASTYAVKSGVNIWLSFLVAAVAVGIFGMIVERVLIRHLYGRLMDTLLATWGLSLFLVGGITTWLGPQTESVAADLGFVTVAGLAMPRYGLVMIVIAFALLVLTWSLWRYTEVGLVVRGTMQNPRMASVLGINTGRVYTLTFGFGSAITGLAGAALVPVFGASPTMGGYYIAKSFITVISGGPLPLLGTATASGLFAAIDGIVSYRTSSVLGEIGVLLVAIVLLRLLPNGITGRRIGRGV
jgi:branched-subunit amino acid ABC-type transport system permease component